MTWKLLHVAERHLMLHLSSSHRYLDMIVTDGVRETFRKRSKVMSSIRQMLDVHGYLEVETPVLESTAGQCYFHDEPPLTQQHHAHKSHSSWS